MAASVFQIGPSPLTAFLLAPVGLEGNGMEMTVLSALARLGKDPWVEAARLADLSPAAAVDRLAGAILTLCGPGWPTEEARDAARRLVVLLPGHARLDGLAQPGAQPPLPSRRRANMVLIGAVIGATVAFAVLAGLAPRLPGRSAGRPSAISPAPSPAAPAAKPPD